MTIQLLPHPDNLPAFVRGQLKEPDLTAVLDHLVACELCLRQVDGLWAEFYRNPAVSLDPAAAQRLEQQLFKRIRRSDLSGQLFWLGTVGLMSTSVTLFRPMLSTYLALFSLSSRQKKDSHA